MAHERLFDGLNPSQREAVATDAQPLCILAGAGSGKTRVLTRRIAYRVAEDTADARHVLALTFTRKAAGELSSRLTALGVRDRVVTGTFHAIAYAQLRRRWADRGERAPAVLDRKLRVLGPLLPRRRPAAVQPADLAAEIEWAQARLVAPRGYEAEAVAGGRRPPIPAAAMAELYERYELEKRRRGVVDFDDLLVLCARALADDAEFGAAQRWRFRHLFVDEFQDVNPAQHLLLSGWLGNGTDLCVVGDPEQAIYGWNGADAGYLTGFTRRFRGARVVRLVDNYRSTRQVLAVANAVLADGRRGDSRSGLRANRADGDLPTVSAHDTDRDEASAIVRASRRRHGSSRPWSSFAVLARTNAQLVLFEEAFAAAGVPYRVRGAGSFLDRPEVRDALADLRHRPPGTPVAAVLPDLDELVAQAPDDAAERRGHLAQLTRLARECAAADPAATVDGLLGWLTATVGPGDADAGGDTVELATFHAAKGLEWPVVFLVGLERGLVPIARADTPEARAEERRLLYVAVTRAEDELHCSWARRRTYGARAMSRAPSPWLAVVEAAVTALAAGAEGVDWRRFLEDGRARVRQRRPAVGPANPDLAVLAALKSWRSTAARASGVPAYVIFHDATLAAVAERKPRDRAALLGLPGVGPVKAERYGEALLAVVAAHAS